MTCATCAAASERVVKKLASVAEAPVNFSTEKLHIKFEDGALSIDEIKTAVAKACYEALDDIADKQVTIPVGGMTCASCAAAIDIDLRKLTGTKEVSVNLATEKALSCATIQPPCDSPRSSRPSVRWATSRSRSTRERRSTSKRP